MTTQGNAYRNDDSKKQVPDSCRLLLLVWVKSMEVCRIYGQDTIIHATNCHVAFKKPRFIWGALIMRTSLYDCSKLSVMMQASVVGSCGRVSALASTLSA